MEDLKNIVDNISNTEIKTSNIHGLGLFSTTHVTRGTIICILDGQFVPANEFFNKILEWNAISQDVLLVRPCRTKYSFINHSRKPNLVILYYPIRIVALQDIQCGAELTLDYRKEPLSDDYIENHGSTFL